MTLEPETVVDVELEADRGRIFFFLTQQLKPQKCSKKLSFFAAYFFSSKIFLRSLATDSDKKEAKRDFFERERKTGPIFLLYFCFISNEEEEEKKVDRKLSTKFFGSKLLRWEDLDVVDIDVVFVDVVVVVVVANDVKSAASSTFLMMTLLQEV